MLKNFYLVMMSVCAVGCGAGMDESMDETITEADGDEQALIVNRNGDNGYFNITKDTATPALVTDTPIDNHLARQAAAPTIKYTMVKGEFRPVALASGKPLAGHDYGRIFVVPGLMQLEYHAGATEVLRFIVTAGGRTVYKDVAGVKANVNHTYRIDLVPPYNGSTSWSARLQVDGITYPSLRFNLTNAVSDAIYLGKLPNEPKNYFTGRVVMKIKECRSVFEYNCN